MQKFLIGCLIVVAVLVIGGGTAGYFLVIKPGWELVKDAGSFAAEFQQINSQIERSEHFAPPADGDLDQAQFQRFLVAQRDMRAGMEGELEELENKWREIQQEIEDKGRSANIVEIVTAYRDLGGLLLEAKRHQVAALNRYQFSLEEYLWVRNQTFRALGQQVAVTAIGNQGNAELNRQVSDQVVAMVAPHRDELMESYVMAWFGM